MTQQLKYHCLVAQGAQVVLPRPPCLICPCDNHPPNLRCVQRFRPLAGGHCQVALCSRLTHGAGGPPGQIGSAPHVPHPPADPPRCVVTAIAEAQE